MIDKLFGMDSENATSLRSQTYYYSSEDNMGIALNAVTHSLIILNYDPALQ